MSVCVLWLQPAEGDAIVRWAAGFVNGGAGGVFVTYEQIHPHDAFGQVCVCAAFPLDLDNIVVGTWRKITAPPPLPPQPQSAAAAAAAAAY
jgi:hypothetical protein